MYPLAFEIGGRNQNTQLFRSWWTGGTDARDDVDRAPARDAADGVLATALPSPPSFADFSAEGVFAELAARAASKGLPVDLGVLAEPNEANAPEPRPKALDAPPVGEARLPPPGVVTELKGFAFPCDELSPPNRLGNEALRPVEESPWPLAPGVERESLPELREDDVSAQRVWFRRRPIYLRRGTYTQAKPTDGHPERRRVTLTWFCDSIGYP